MAPQQTTTDIYLTMDPGKKRDPRLDDAALGFIPLDEEPIDFHPIEDEKEKPREETGLLHSLTHAPKFITDAAAKFATDITQHTNDETMLGSELRGFLGGATQGAAELLSPINIAATLLPELKGATTVIAPTVSKIASMGAKAANLGMAAEGGNRVLNEPGWGNKALGAAEMLFGGLGAKDIRPQFIKEPEIVPQGIFNEGINYLKPNDFMSTAGNTPDLSLSRTPNNVKLLPSRPEDTRFIDSPNKGQFDLYNPDQLEEFNRGKLRTPGTQIPIEERPLNKTGVRSKTIENDQDRLLNQKFSDVAKRLFKEESGELNTDNIRKAFAKKIGSENPADTRKAISVRIGQLDARNAPDIDYKKLLPKELAAIKLSPGETWRDRLVYGMNKVASSRQVPGTVPASENAIDTLMQAIRESIPTREAQEASYSAERGQRLTRAENVNRVGMAGYKERLKQMAGKYRKMEYEPVKLNQKDTDRIMNLIWNSRNLTTGEKLSASSGFSKIIGATKEKTLPQRNELEKLGRVLGKENIDEITELYASLGGLPSKLFHEFVSIPKSIGATMDLSAPFRQGLGLVHTKEFWKNLPEMVRAFRSQEVYDGMMQAIKDSPNFQAAVDAGLDLGKLSGGAREEQVFSTLLSELPGFKHSDRAFSGFLDKLRFDVFNRMVNDGKLANEPWMREHLAKYINDATGKGSLGKWEKDADLLNLAFYSPRLIASRARMAAKIFDPALPNSIRKEYIKSLASIASFGTLLGKIAKAGGAEVSSDPTSPDFGKIKIGNTRIDPFGGFQQYAVLLAKIASGYKTSSVSERRTYLNTGKFGSPTNLSVLQDFARSKASPVAGYVYDSLKGSTPTGQKFLYSPETIDRMLPMIVNDLYELYQEDPDLIPGLGAALGATTGFGVTTYDKESLGRTIGKKLGTIDEEGNEQVPMLMNPFGRNYR